MQWRREAGATAGGETLSTRTADPGVRAQQGESIMTLQPSRSPLARYGLTAAAAALLLVAGLAVAAPSAADESPPAAHHCSDCPHAAAHHQGMAHGAMGMHGGMNGGMAALHAQLAPLFMELELTAEQQGYMQQIHQAMAAAHEKGESKQAHHHAELMKRLESGTIELSEAQLVIDDHLGQLHDLLYSIAEPLVDLFNSLDDEQRAKVTAHLQALHGDGE
jgi:hypothetical protein